MTNYLAAWKTFRRLGNEPAATAAHVLAQPAWPSTDGPRVLDVGCGDGRMIEAFLRKTRHPVSKVVLLDPEDWMLEEASNQLQGLGLEIEVDTVVGVADIEGVELAQKVTVGLAIHVVYLFPYRRFRHFIDHWPAAVPLFVVLDGPISVFSELWESTAPEYAIRSARVHEYLGKEANGTLNVLHTAFTTSVSNPFDLVQPVQNLVLSLLCYCDYEDLPSSTKAEIERIILKHTKHGSVVCACSCYQVLRDPSDERDKGPVTCHDRRSEGVARVLARGGSHHPSLTEV